MYDKRNHPQYDPDDGMGPALAVALLAAIVVWVAGLGWILFELL